MNPLLAQVFRMGLTAVQFSFERQRIMAEQIAAIPPGMPDAEVNRQLERISAEAVADAQASIDRARAEGR